MSVLHAIIAVWMRQLCTATWGPNGKGGGGGEQTVQQVAVCSQLSQPDAAACLPPLC